MTQIITTVDGVALISQVQTGIISYAGPGAINNIFGQENVTRWADLDNNNDAQTIAGRLAWSLALATDELNSRLLGGIYAVPFVAPIPYSIQDLTARLAGCLLYDARRIADLEGPDEDTARYDVQPHRRFILDFTRALRSGKRRLIGQTQIGTMVPQSAAQYMSPWGCSNGINNPVNVEQTIWLPFIWTPLVIYPPPFAPWPGCGTLLNWYGF